MRYVALLAAIAAAWCSIARADWGDSPVTVLSRMPWLRVTLTDPVYRMDDKERGTVCYITGSKHAISCVALGHGGKQ